MAVSHDVLNKYVSHNVSIFCSVVATRLLLASVPLPLLRRGNYLQTRTDSHNAGRDMGDTFGLTIFDGRLDAWLCLHCSPRHSGIHCGLKPIADGDGHRSGSLHSIGPKYHAADARRDAGEQQYFARRDEHGRDGGQNFGTLHDEAIQCPARTQRPEGRAVRRRCGHGGLRDAPVSQDPEWNRVSGRTFAGPGFEVRNGGG